MTLVIDASLVVAAPVDTGGDGAWEAELLATEPLAAPHPMPVEVADILRRAVRNAEISDDTAALAHADLLDLRIELFSYAPFADRVWELRANLTAYDA